MTGFDLEYIIKGYLVNPLRNWTRQAIDSIVPVPRPAIVTSSDVEDFGANEPYFLNAFVADVSYPSIRTFTQNYAWKQFNFILDLNFAISGSQGRTGILRIANDLSSFFSNPGQLSVIQYAMAKRLRSAYDSSLPNEHVWEISDVSNIEDPGREFKFCVNPKYQMNDKCMFDPNSDSANCYVCEGVPTPQFVDFKPYISQEDYLVPAVALPEIRITAQDTIAESSSDGVHVGLTLNGYHVTRGDQNYLLFRNSRLVDSTDPDSNREAVFQLLNINDGIVIDVADQEAVGYPFTHAGQIVDLASRVYDPIYFDMFTKEQTVEIGPTTFVFIDDDDVGSEVRNDFNLTIIDRSIGNLSFQSKKKVLDAPMSKPEQPTFVAATEFPVILRATVSLGPIVTEAEWLAGNTAQLDSLTVSTPASLVPHYKAFAYTEKPLISIKRSGSLFEDRDSYNPDIHIGDLEVIRSIDGRDYYTYVQKSADSPESNPVSFVVAT